jgi:hypothetical protein
VRPRKNRPVLFEVVACSRRAGGRSAPPRTAALPAGAATPPAVPLRPTTPPSIETDEAASAEATGVYFEDGRLHLALGWLHLVVIGVALAVVLAATFQVGRRSAQPGSFGSAGIDDLLAGQPPADTLKTEAAVPVPGQGRGTGQVLTPLGQAAGEETRAKPPPPAPPVAKQAEVVEAFTFASGAYYVVVQHFRSRDGDQAVAARDFLRSKSVGCTVRQAAGDLELVATEAFSSEAAAQTLSRRVRDLGKEYWNAGGGYDFAGAKPRRF